MRETEIKLRVADHEPIRRRLGELGAERIGQFLETNWILDRPDGALRASGCGLRIRRAEEQSTGELQCSLTFKGPAIVHEVKSREEIETGIEDAQAAVEVFLSLGYSTCLRYTKRRESWHLEECRVELDEAPVLGLFVEIEGPDERAIATVRERLELEDAEVVTFSYVAMLWSYCEEKGIQERVLSVGE